MYNPSVLQP